MPAPYNYNIQATNPFLAGLQGYQMAQQQRQQAMKLEQEKMAMAQAQRQQQRQMEFQDRMAAIAQNPYGSGEAYNQLAAQYPEMMKLSEQVRGMRSEQQLKNDVSIVQKINAAMAAGNYDVAKSQMEEYKNGLQNSGRQNEMQSIDNMLSMIDDPEKRNELSVGLNNYLRSQMGPKEYMAYFDKLPTGRSGKTPEQIERELRMQERGVEIRAEELKTRQDEFKQKFGRFQPGVEKRFNDISDALIETQKNIGEYETLALDMDKLSKSGVKGGVVQSIQEFLKQTLGTTNEVTRLLTKARGIRASSAMRNLPPGAASDADVALALSGTPAQNSSPETYASWLRGTAKMMRIDAAYKDEQLKYLENSEDGSIRGWNQYWKENKDQIIMDALLGSISESQGALTSTKQDIESSKKEIMDKFSPEQRNRIEEIKRKLSGQ